MAALTLPPRHTLGLVAHGSASTASLVTTSWRVWAALGPQVELLEAGVGTKPPLGPPAGSQPASTDTPERGWAQAKPETNLLPDH